MTRRTIPRSTDGAARNVALAAGEVAYDGPRQTLLLGTGAIPRDLGGTKRSSLLNAGQYRRLTDKVNDRFDARDISGFDPAGNNSSRAALQKGFDQAWADGVAFWLPTGKAVADATITVTNGLTVLGDSTGLGRAIAGYTEGAATGPASRIHFAHSGEGIRFEGGAGIYDGVLLRDLMFTRDQPPVVDGAAWEPADHDYNLVMNGMAGLSIQNVLDLNPSRGIKMLGGGGIGRLFLENYMSQPLITGVNVELAADVVRMANTHFWAFWRDHPEVHRWTLENCDHVWLKRCDTPLFTNFFSIGARSAFRISRNAHGTVTKMKVSNYDIDYGKYCIWFDNTATNAWARFSNGTLQANNSNGSLSNVPASTQRQNLRMDGTSCFANFNGLEVAGSSGVSMDLGAGNRVEISDDLWVQSYGETSGNTDPCFNIGAGSTLVRQGQILETTPGGMGAGPLLGGVGRVVGIRKAYSPGFTPAAGAYTGVTLVQAEYIEDGYTVTGAVTATITNAGTGTGAMTITLPTEGDIFTSFAAVDVTDHKLLSANLVAGTPATAQLFVPGGGNVGVTGHTISLSFTYVRKAG